MLDALFPFVDTLVGQVDAGASIADSVAVGGGRLPDRGGGDRIAGSEDRAGAAAGRAQRWHPDPGAVSLGLIVDRDR